MTSIGNGGIPSDKREWKKLDPPKAPPEKANAEDEVGKELNKFKMDLKRSKEN